LASLTLGSRRGYLISGDEKFLDPYHSGGNAYTAAIRKVRDLTSDDLPQQSRIDELNELAKTWRSGFDEEPPAPKQVTSSS
jgi:CHASE3 domain sensor protein